MKWQEEIQSPEKTRFHKKSWDKNNLYIKKKKTQHT